MDVLSLPFLRPFASWAPLLLRIGVGLVMANHGWSKFQNIAGTTGFFESLGIPAPGVMAWVVTIIELVGGICIVLGLATRLWAFLFVFVAIGAIVLVKMKDGFSSFELEFALLMGALALAVGGPGAASLDRTLGVDRS